MPPVAVIVSRTPAASLGTPPRPATRSDRVWPGPTAPVVAPTLLRVSRSRDGDASASPPPPLDQPKLSTTTSVSLNENKQISPFVYGTRVKSGMISPARKFTVDAWGRLPHG